MDPIESVAAPVEPVIRGRQTWLRPAEREDLDAFVEWSNDARVTRYLTPRGPLGRGQWEHRYEQSAESQGKDGWFFVICRLGERRAIGHCGLFEVDYRNGGAGIGILIGDASNRSQGLGTDALEALLDFGFGILRLERLWLDVYTSNPRARRSYEKAGFTHEGTFRHAYHRDGQFIDSDRMAILRAEWAERRSRDPLRPPVSEA
jgi:RimJ/RimL family protein N-acetyltransferase